jgi:hypothetical protein
MGMGERLRGRRAPPRAALVGLAVLTALLVTPAAVADPPVLSGVPGDQVLEAESSAGTSFSWPDPTATDLDGNATTVDCSPPSGTTFPIATTTVTCTATDTASGEQTSQTFTVTVRDTTPPTVDVPTGITTEATWPGGAVVVYPASASDSVDGSRPVGCSPAAGSMFALGTTTVTCTASDSRGNTGSSTFSVTVQDTTPPSVTVPPSITAEATGARGAVARFSASASDLVDPTPTLRCVPRSGSRFPVGTTTVTCFATDDSGNAADDSFTVTVEDTRPPKAVTKLRAKPGDRFVLLTWVAPKVDFRRVTIARSPGKGGARSTVVYNGSARQLRDGNLRNGVRYRYVVVAHDAAGNASPGVVVRAVPNRPLLYAPAEAAVVSKPPLLRWLGVTGATYYNVQLYRAPVSRPSAVGAKILSTWPVRPQIALARTWEFNGRTQRLTPGTYHWFVWPGIGPKSANRYGPVLGKSTFVVQPEV